jgi:hypothetical protein
VADPTIAKDESFFFDYTARFFAGGGVGFEYRILLRRTVSIEQEISNDEVWNRFAQSK